MGGEEVVELSVAETQALRAELGLPPLRGVPGAGSGGSDSAIATPSTTAHAATANNDGAAGSSKEELSLSIDETNALRAKIGLAPLKTAIDEKKAGSSASTAIHAKPTDAGAESEAQKRIEDAAARREAKERLQKLEEEGKREEKGGESALDFAAKMRAGKNGAKNDGDKADKGGKKRKKKKKLLTKNPQLSLPGEDEEEESAEYTSSDLKGMKVAHSAADFAAGSTAVLTLADTSILEVDPDSNKVTGFGEGSNELVNATMEGETRALENLRRKRRVELGAGRAGGYAGYDDDEFEETGGVGLAEGRGPLARSLDGGGSGKKPASKGFAIGADGTVQRSKDESKKSDLFSALGGGAVSLQSRHAPKIASDFVAPDDEDGEREERLRKEKARHAKMLEKMRRKDKKKLKKAKKKGRRERSEDSDDDEEGKGGGGGLLESLEATAVKQGEEGTGRKRRRRNGDDAVDVDGKATGSGDEDVDEEAQRRKRFDEIMDKGRARTDRAFKKPLVSKPSAALDDAGDEDEGEDDAFLNAALAKARRLKRLKEMSGAKSTGGGAGPAKGEAAVVQAVEKMKREEAAKEDTAMGEANGERKGGLTFEFDEVQEFTRALRAREEREKRSGGAEQGRRGVKVATAKETKAAKSEENAAVLEEAEGRVEDVDMQELAEEMKDDDDNNNAHPQHDDADAFGSTAESAPVGRGMAGFLSLLKRTGEISETAAREEMRGRAKDERTYDDYAKLDLDKVVRANTSGRNAHEKDVELANREIKLEYRDGFGRLLTRKEAYREMCYQFHGHGSSKKNQERRLKKIEREQEEKSAVARGGTFGALKKTQEATGSAFVVHKT